MASVQRSENLLEGLFSLFPTKTPLYNVCLNRKSLSFIVKGAKENNDNLKNVLISDIIGCKCRKSKTHNDNAAYFSVFAYPFRTKTFSGKRTRYRLELTFAIRTMKNFEDNLKLAQRWRNVILCLTRGVKVEKEGIDVCVPPVGKTILVLINPHSGPGKAKQIFEKDVAPMLQEADVPYKMVVTEHAGHATEIMETLKLSEWYAVVIVSGDGLIYEVINGLMGRPDWSEAIKFPVGCIPGGSGNALCWTINYTAGHRYDFTFHICFDKTQCNSNGLGASRNSKMQYFSFLMVSWGIVADIDYESEKMRALGSTRFTIYALMRILSLRTYKAKISFLPLTEYKPKPLKQRVTENGTVTSRHYSVLNHSQSFHKSVHDSVVEPGMSGSYKPISERSRSVSMPSHMNPNSSNNACEEPKSYVDRTQEDIENFYLENVVEEEQETEPVNIQTDQKSNPEDLKDTVLKNGDVKSDNLVNNNSRKPVPSPLLPPLGQPVPGSWTTLDEDFVTIMALYQPYIGPDNLAAPDSRLNDGCIHLMLVRAGTPKNALLNMFIDMEKGEHINSPYVEVIKVQAFRLEPLSSSGNIMIDGERIDPCVIQGQMLPGISRIMAIHYI
ncbi:hypothetical protein KUTeg_004313, partial [Tegillarca granosa]